MNIKINKNIPFYALCIIIFGILKWWFKYSSVNKLQFLLYPTNQLIKLITGSNPQYIINQGYLHAQYNILIEKSCSGFSFMCISFIMISFLVIQHIEKRTFKSLAIIGALFLAYFTTIFTNSSRILLSIIGQNMGNLYLPIRPHNLIHEVIGVLTYLISLVLIYFIFNLIIQKIKSNTL